MVQTANLVLHNTIERIHVGNKYGDIPRGIFIIRGENVVLMGEVKADSQMTEANRQLTKVDVDEILELQQAELEAKQEKERIRSMAFKEFGLNASNYDGINDEQYWSLSGFGWHPSVWFNSY